MSRGVKDLRELICVSRLTFHQSDEEVEVSESDNDDSKNDNDDELKLQGRLSSMSMHSYRSSSTFSLSHSKNNSRVLSPDSGCVVDNSPLSSATTNNDFSGVESNSQKYDVKDSSTPCLESNENIPKGASHKRKRNKKGKNSKRLPVKPPRHELPKPQPLPPVQTCSTTHRAEPTAQAISSASNVDQKSTSVTKKSAARINFDDMLLYMDANIVFTWLERANKSIQELSRFINKSDNFVRFAHFWLSDFSDGQKNEIFLMEYDILMEEIGLAFAVGRESSKVTRKHLTELCSAIFKEYPTKLLSGKASLFFLDYLDILTSEKHEEYKKLLSDVKCSTSNKQYAQLLLATRSFALVNIWTAIVNFFRNITCDGASMDGVPVHDLWATDELVWQRRLIQSIRLGYTDVIQYLFVNGHINPAHVDSHKRTPIFSAVMHNKPKVVQFLTTQVKPCIDINYPSDTGNTPLHAAVNSGNLAVAEILCDCVGIDINPSNPQCENATPLHLAIMHGHEKVIECLLKHGADLTVKMGGSTPKQLAIDFDHTEIVAMLDKR